MQYCPYCGNRVEPDSIFCTYCGKKLIEESTGYISQGTRKYYSVQSPLGHQDYKPSYVQERPYYFSIRDQRVVNAPISERFVALIIDGVINYFCCFYNMIKDGIRDGQSFGKSLFNLRVIDYETRQPATILQSIIRNCLCIWLDYLSCYALALFSEEGRRIGDHFAGTIVIKDI